MCDLGLFGELQDGCRFLPLADIASLATITGVLLAILAAWIAYSSHRRAAKDAAAAHMHGLFRDYLRLRTDWAHLSAVKNGRRYREDITEQVISFKLYTLEEMLAWVERHRPPRFLRSIDAGKMSYLNGWEQTIIAHLKDDAKTGGPDGLTSTVRSLSRHHQCYGDNFMVFALTNLGATLKIELEKEDSKRARRLAEIQDRRRVTPASAKSKGRPDQSGRPS